MASRAGARPGRTRRAHRGTGAAITAVLLVLIVALVFVILNNRPQYRVTPADTGSLIKAISEVPKSDVDGADPIQRPPGTVRSYYTVRGRVTTVVYVARQPVSVEKQAALDVLNRAGWTPPPGAPPGRVSTQTDSYTAVFSNQSALLQLAVTSIKDVTSVTYIMQSTQ